MAKSTVRPPSGRGRGHPAPPPEVSWHWVRAANRTSLINEMMWPYYSDGSSWLWMSGMMIVFLGAVAFLAVWAFRSISRSQRAGDDAMAILRKRLASGEISQDDYEKTKRSLQN